MCSAILSYGANKESEKKEGKIKLKKSPVFPFSLINNLTKATHEHVLYEIA
jgi:hypothetical protein